MIVVSRENQLSGLFMNIIENLPFGSKFNLLRNKPQGSAISRFPVQLRGDGFCNRALISFKVTDW